MKTTTIAASALVVLLVAGLATVALANSGHSIQAAEHGPNGPHGQSDDDHGQNWHRLACWQLSTNETLSVSVHQGRYVATVGNSTVSGNASGTFNFQVYQTYLRGCTLSLTGGSFTLGNSTYTITGGSIVLNHGGRSGIGSGTTTGGTFIIRIAGLRGNSTSADVGAIGLDFKNGSSEFLVVLTSPEAED